MQIASQFSLGVPDDAWLFLRSPKVDEFFFEISSSSSSNKLLIEIFAGRNKYVVLNMTWNVEKSKY